MFLACLCEVSRDTSQILYAYVNGDRAENRSRSTGLSVSTQDGLNSASPTPTSGFTLDIGRFGVFLRPTVVVSGGHTFGNAAWINTAIQNTPYGFRGVINEVIVYDRKLTELERQMVYGYLSRKYKMDDKLPYAYETVHRSAKVIHEPYWDIKPHPNPGKAFSGITLNTFLTD